MNDVASESANLRDRHLFGKGPKRLLSLDGGGVRGAATVAFLERIEKIIAAEQNKTPRAGLEPSPAPAPKPQAPPVRLGDWFDLVGGTSTGAIIAGALALGHTTSEIKDFYLRLAPRVFKRPFWRIPYLQAKFDARALSEEINAIVKDRTLDSPDLITGLAVITKRMDTGSPWILANNKMAPNWEDRPAIAGKKPPIGNKHYKLAALVRASTAAPHYFDPEILSILETEQPDALDAMQANLSGLPFISELLAKIRAWRTLASKRRADPETHGLFIDGGVTPYNSPTFALLMLAALKPFGICWQLGPDNFTIVSVGTGTFRTRVAFAEVGFAGPLRLALRALLSIVTDNEYLALAQMQWLGECLTPWTVNSEIGSLADETPPGGRWFRFARYDLRLEREWLAQNVSVDLSETEVKRLQHMDDPGIIEPIYEIAGMAADKQVRREHFFPDGKKASA